MCLASKAYTLQLDLDQLVMKTDKLNDCSQSCSSSSCSTSATEILLGQSTKKVSSSKALSTTTTANFPSKNFKTNYYDKYLDRFANLIDNYQNTATSSFDHFSIKPVFYGNSDGLNEIFQHNYDQFNTDNLIHLTNVGDFEWDNRHFIKSSPCTNKQITKNFCTNNTARTINDFSTFIEANNSKLNKMSVCLFYMFCMVLFILIKFSLFTIILLHL